MSAEEIIAAAKERLETLIAPINGGVGEDSQYHELFDAIGVEIAKLTAVDGGKIEWGTIANNAEELLNEKTKDFRLGLFYAMGKTMSSGIPGLLDGLVLVQELTTQYWDTMFPNLRRPKTRGNAVGMFSDTVGPHVQTLNPGPKDRDLVMAIDQLARTLDSDLSGRLGEAYGGLSKLREGIRGLVARAPAEKVAPPISLPAEQVQGEQQVYTPDVYVPEEAQVYVPEGGGEVYSPEGGGGPGPNPASIVDLASATEAIASLLPVFEKAALVTRNADPASPMGYRLARIAALALVAKEPPNEGGRTAIPAPVNPGFDGLAAAEDWASLAAAAESAAVSSPFWLDAHRWLIVALENSGDDFARVRDVVAKELGLLVTIAPGIVELKFEDGTPFASDETKAWLPTVAASSGGAPRSPVDKAIAEARKAFAEADVPRAIATLTRAVNSASSPSLKFKGRLEIARIALDGGFGELAHTQLDVLERTSEQHALPDWDPAVAADLYALLYRARRPLYLGAEDPALRAKLTTTFERLCSLDPMAAMRLTQVTE